MREILFRGKNKYSGGWMETGCIKQNKKGQVLFKYDYGFVGIISKTFTQYTEVKDKNGNKIYEGDIVQYYRDENYFGGQMEVAEEGTFEIVYSNGCFGLDKFKPLWELCDKDGSTKYCEVIGNIFDNPELLEDKKCK